jgi:hypothetical protein
MVLGVSHIVTFKAQKVIYCLVQKTITDEITSESEPKLNLQNPILCFFYQTSSTAQPPWAGWFYTFSFGLDVSCVYPWDSTTKSTFTCTPLMAFTMTRTRAFWPQTGIPVLTVILATRTIPMSTSKGDLVSVRDSIPG